MWWKKSEQSSDRPFVSAVVPAAGSSSRMGEGCNKLLIALGGMPLLVRTLLVFEHCDQVDEVIVVCRESDIMLYAKLCQDYGMKKVRQIIRGGDSRAQSVLCGVQACSAQAELVAIHDGARPLLRQQTLVQVIADASTYGAAAPVVAMKDSVKRVQDGFVMQDVPRAEIAAVQTPQVFSRTAILSALERAAVQANSLTDDCAAAEQAGIRVFASRGDYTNIKITTHEDIMIAEAFLQEIEE